MSIVAWPCSSSGWQTEIAITSFQQVCSFGGFRETSAEMVFPAVQNV
jgi:hypothetical protein